MVVVVIVAFYRLRLIDEMVKAKGVTFGFCWTNRSHWRMILNEANPQNSLSRQFFFAKLFSERSSCCVLSMSLAAWPQPRYSSVESLTKPRSFLRRFSGDRKLSQQAFADAPCLHSFLCPYGCTIDSSTSTTTMNEKNQQYKQGIPKKSYRRNLCTQHRADGGELSKTLFKRTGWKKTNFIWTWLSCYRSRQVPLEASNNDNHVESHSPFTICVQRPALMS